MLLGRAAGDAVDRFGRTPVIFTGIAICSVLVVALGFAPSALALGALWFAIGLGSALMWAGINVLTVEAVPGNRAGGTSVVSAVQIRGQRGRPGDVAPALPRRSAARVPGRRDPGRDRRRLHRTRSAWHASSSDLRKHRRFLLVLLRRRRVVLLEPGRRVSGSALFLALVFFTTYLTLRARASFHILRAAYPDSKIEFKRIWGAYFAGYGFNSVIPARGGDVIRHLPDQDVGAELELSGRRPPRSASSSSST